MASNRMDKCSGQCYCSDGASELDDFNGKRMSSPNVDYRIVLSGFMIVKVTVMAEGVQYIG
jgi:hypothetical protein